MWITTTYKQWTLWQLAAIAYGCVCGLWLGKKWQDYKDARDAGVVAE